MSDPILNNLAKGVNPTLNNKNKGVNPTFNNHNKSDVYFTLWSSSVLPWQLSLPWQHVETAVGSTFTNLAK